MSDLETPVAAITDENRHEELRAEVVEQARLNGMGAERELAIRAGVERLREALTPFACSCVPGVCGQDNEHSPGVVCHARKARKIVGPYPGMPTGELDTAAEAAREQDEAIAWKIERDRGRFNCLTAAIAALKVGRAPDASPARPPAP